MNHFFLFALPLAGILFFSGCSSSPHRFEASSAMVAPEAPMEMNPSSVPSDAKMQRAEQARMLVWTADLEIEVSDVTASIATVTDMTKKQGGYVERTTNRKDGGASLTIRVPAALLKATVSNLEALGTVTHQRVSAEDVTEKYVDIDARLKNKIALRDRLKQLLDKATAVKDILSIETELNRVQSDIDSMTAQLKSLRGRSDYASIDVTLSRKQILGPLGYFFKGLFWGIEKLFVIQD